MTKNLKDLKIIGIKIKGRVKETHFFLDRQNNEIGKMEFKFWGGNAVYKSVDEEIKLIKKGWLVKKYYMKEKDRILLSGKQKFISRNASFYLPDYGNFKLRISGYRRPYLLTDVDKNEDMLSIGTKRIAPPDIEIKILSQRLKDIKLSDYLIIFAYFIWVCIKRARITKF